MEDKPQMRTISYAGWPNNWIVTPEGIKKAVEKYPEIREKFKNGLYFIRDGKKEFI